jgi:hypothetical protein
MDVGSYLGDPVDFPIRGPGTVQPGRVPIGSPPGCPILRAISPLAVAAYSGLEGSEPSVRRAAMSVNRRPTRSTFTSLVPQSTIWARDAEDTFTRT